MEEDEMSCNGICVSVAGSGPGGAYKMSVHSYGSRPGAEYGGPSYFRDPNALTALEFEKSRDKTYGEQEELGPLRYGNDSIHYRTDHNKNASLGGRLGYVQKSAYAGKLGEKVYAVQPHTGEVMDVEKDRINANIAYMQSLQSSGLGGRALDYSLMASARQAWQQMRDLLEGKLSVTDEGKMGVTEEGKVSNDVMDGHLKVYTTISGVLPVLEYAAQKAGIQNVLGYQQEAVDSQRAASVARRRSLLEDLIHKEKERQIMMN